MYQRWNDRRRLPVLGAVMGLAILLSLLPVRAETERAELLAAGTKWQTTYYVRDSGKAGPCVMIVGGVHGDEPAGARAAGQILSWPVLRGRLVILPRANVVALEADKRNTPGEPKEAENLNRNFPGGDGPKEPRGELARAIWDLFKAQKPDWLLDLHEGFDFRKVNPKSTGGSVIHFRTDEGKTNAAAMLDAVNATMSEENKKFVPLSVPVGGSLARAAGERLDGRAFILESPQKGQDVSLRARQHRLMVNKFLTRLKMVDCPVERMLPPPPAGAPGEKPLRVAIYNGPGTSITPGVTLEKILRQIAATRTDLVCPQDIRGGVLAGQFDAVIFPGGSGSGQGEALGEEGRKIVREFVEGGGGYLGICGGAYLGTSRYPWGLRIIDACTVDSKHWKRGTGDVRMELTDLGREILGGQKGEFDIRYANGPLLGPNDMPELPDYRVLAYFRSEMRKNDAPEGVMLNSPAMIAGEFGKGRVILFSPHPEKSEPLYDFVRRAVLWTAHRELAFRRAEAAPALKTAQ